MEKSLLAIAVVFAVIATVFAAVAVVETGKSLCPNKP